MSQPLRRYPHLTSEDMVVLRALPPDKARQFENFIRRQRSDANGQQNFEQSVILCSPHDLGALAGHEIARWGRGAGGGRKRITDEPGGHDSE